MSIRQFIQKIESYLFGVRLHVYESVLHGKLEVWMVNGKLVLNSANANQSYDSLHEVFRYCFQAIHLDEQPVHHVLLLGLGVGSVPSIIEEELMMHCMVTGIEYDPIMLELGRKYFNLGKFRQLQIVQQDAFEFVSNDRQSYELIVIDLFVDDKVPASFRDTIFLNHLMRLTEPEGFVLFNFIVKSSEQKNQFNDIYNYFNDKNGTLKVLSPLGQNKVICWQKGLN